MPLRTKLMSLSRSLKPAARFCVTLCLISVLLPGTALGQGTFDPWVPWTEVSVHQVHLPNDQILYWAYSGFSAWRWSPGSVLAETPNLSANTFCSGHAGLADGRYLVAGGINLPILTSNAAEIFDFSTSSWTSQTPMAADRFYPTLTTLGDGRVIAIGGNGNMADIPEIFDPATNAWTQLPGAQLPIGIYPFMFLLPNGQLFFAGPGIFTGTLDVPTQAWALVATSVNDGASAVMYEPGKIMKCGGFATPTALTETIDMTVAIPAWSAAQNMAFERHDHSLTLLPDGTVLTVGGHDSADNAVLPAEIFDPQNGTWTTSASLGIPRQYHSTSMLMRDGRVLVGGGDGYASTEIYNPPYLAAGNRPTVSSVPTQISYGQTFSLSWTSFASVSKVTFLRLGAETHSFDQNQRYMELAFQFSGPIGIGPNGQMVGSINVTAPATGNDAPPGYYMLFVVDNQGRPSVGEYVRIP